MPSIYVNVPKLEQEKKDALAKKAYEAAAAVLKGSDIYTFVKEYDTLYKNGEPQEDQKMVVANIEAGPIKPEKMAEKVDAIAEKMLEGVKEVLGEDKNLTLIYHNNDLDRIAIGGKTLATKMKKD